MEDEDREGHNYVGVKYIWKPDSSPPRPQVPMKHMLIFCWQLFVSSVAVFSNYTQTYRNVSFEVHRSRVGVWIAVVGYLCMDKSWIYLNLLQIWRAGLLGYSKWRKERHAWTFFGIITINVTLRYSDIMAQSEKNAEWNCRNCSLNGNNVGPLYPRSSDKISSLLSEDWDSTEVYYFEIHHFAVLMRKEKNINPTKTDFPVSQNLLIWTELWMNSSGS